MFSLFQASAYNLSEKDYIMIDTLEIKIFNIIDENEKITPEIVVKSLKNIVSTHKLSQRLDEIVFLIIDDVKFEYFLEEYELDFDEMTQQDCFE
jgi:hypothetical protein